MSPSARPPLPLPAPEPLVAPADFTRKLCELGVSLDASDMNKLGDYLARLLAMNELMNLTAIKEPGEVWHRHALDALSLVPLLEACPSGARLLDVGSGGGLPGMPLAIARRDLSITLLDATQKKTAFLSAVASALELANVSVLTGRAETLSIGKLAGSFDIVTARAVARLAALLPITLPFAKPSGMVLLIKGERAAEELGEATGVLKKLGGSHERTVATPTGRIVVIRRRG